MQVDQGRRPPGRHRRGRGSHLDRPFPQTPARDPRSRDGQAQPAPAPSGRPRPEGVRRPRSRSLGPRLAHGAARPPRRPHRSADRRPRAAARHRQRGGGDRGRRVRRRHAARARPGRPDPRDRPQHGGDPPVDHRARDGVRRLVLAGGRLWLLASNPAEVIGIDLSDPARPASCPAQRRPRHRPRGRRGLPVGDALRRRQALAHQLRRRARPTSRRAAGLPGSRCARAPCGSPTAPTARSRGSTSGPACRPRRRSGSS